TVEHFRIAEESGDVDEEVVEEEIDLGGVLLEMAHVIGQLVELAQNHAAENAAVERARFVKGKIDAVKGAQQTENALQLGLWFGIGGFDGRARPQKRGMAGNAMQFLSNGGRGQNEIDRAAGVGVGGKARERRGSFVL